jgi:hypothetical protein
LTTTKYKISMIDSSLVFCYILHFFILITSFIASVHFFYLLFVGLLFSLFTHFHIHYEYHKLVINIITILLIELISQIHLFIFIAFFIFLNVYFVPKIRTLFYFPAVVNIIYSFILYIFLFIFFYFQSLNIYSLANVLVINLIVDCIIVGILF